MEPEVFFRPPSPRAGVAVSMPAGVSSTVPPTSLAAEAQSPAGAVPVVLAVADSGTPSSLSQSSGSGAASAGTAATPTAATGAHGSPAARSPAAGTSPAKAAKHQVSQDFRKAGFVRAAGVSTPPTATVPVPPVGRLSKPNIVDFAIQLQSEPGLMHWWNQVTHTLREHFGAERATLAVATDATDVENVPWAQVATFWAHPDDDRSQTANKAPSQSSGSAVGSFSPDAVGGDDTKPKSAVSQRVRSPLGANTTTTTTRPKLESRHSYAGYPTRPKFSPGDHTAPDGLAPLQRSLSPATNPPSAGKQASDAGPGLYEELLRAHDTQIAPDDLAEGSGEGSSRILQPPQPLESEADPLITSTGVLRVFGRERATVLTREYMEPAQATARSEQKPLREAPVSPGRHEPGKNSSFVSKSKHTRVDRRRLDMPQPSAPLQDVARISAGALSLKFAYQDYEQFPGTPWMQSPAPSPAARADPNDNPFFAQVADHDAFAEDPPQYAYNSDAPIPAIGVDRARSIIQLPLIHPNARLSHTLNSRAVREDNKSKHRSVRSRTERLSTSRPGPTTSTDQFAMKKIPIAILSVMAPNVPYPQDLIDSLHEMAPLLATSFYTARSHSNILIELAAISGRRQTSALKLHTYDQQALGNVAAATGLNLVGPGLRLFSPNSPISSASTSAHSTTTFHSTRDSAGAVPSTGVTPGWDHQDPPSRGGRSWKSLSPGDGAREITDDYFSKISPQRGNSRDGLAVSPLAVSRSGATSRQGGSKSKRILHSHGATFASTHPSLPESTNAAGDEMLETPGLAGEDVTIFKEPSSSVLRTMIDNGATQQFIAEPDHGHLVWANAKFMAYRNASKDNIHEQLWGNIHPKDLRRFQSEWHRSLESGEQLSHQVRLKRFDGQHRYFHIRFLPLKDKYGVTKYWHGQAMDIHDLHEAEVKAAKSKEKLASEAKYRALANSLPVIIFAASVSTGMTFANTQWLSQSGQTQEEALGFGFLDHVHPDDLDKCRFPGISSTSLELQNRQNQSPVRPSAYPIVRSDTSASSAPESEETTTTLKSLSERATTDQADLPNELLRGLAKDGIIRCMRDQQGNLSITTEMRLKNSKGEYRWHLVQGSYIEPVNFGLGEAQWFIACTDISNQKHTEAKIQQANSALEDVNTALEKEMRQKMSYLSSMSHEIRTPLNGIIGNLQFLINSGLEETAADWAHGAQEAAKNMHDLINDILDLSKAEANMLQLVSHWFSPRNLIEQVLDMLNSKAAEKEIDLSFECAEDVPKLIRGDSGRMRQVLLNLLGNSIKFTRIGEVTVKCERLDRVPKGIDLPELGPTETFVRWTVTDTGTGFTAEDQNLLFKPYSQIKNKSTRDVGGTGLGLTLCKTMVVLHGGKIEATSKPGLGATFTFFARFKIRKESTLSHQNSVKSVPGTTTYGLGSTQGPISPLFRTSAGGDVVRESPAPLSDSSSVRSTFSADHRNSLRSSTSTTESLTPMKLTLPPYPIAPRSPDVSLSSTTKSAELISPNPSLDAVGSLSQSSAKLSQSQVPLSSPQTIPPRRSPIDLERTSFRPPMVSTLVVCRSENARRITCEQIRTVVPQTVPCNVTSVESIQAAINLLHGEEPVMFTHIVLRLTSANAIHQAIKTIFAEPKHNRVCVVVVVDQIQVRSLKKIAPDLDLEELSKMDRVKLVMKPAHTHKLAKIFDPFNENARTAKDPKEAKRQEEKRLQKESYALFKKVLGNKGVRVLAVEDNKLQMNILLNFLARICSLDVIKAWNGQECLNLYKSHDPGYYSVIITDIEMPIMDGLTMCRRIRDWEQGVGRDPIPVVSMSANSFSEGWNQSSAAGFSHFCPKPVNFQDLGHILIELTDPATPHKYLSERQMPKAMLKKLGLLTQDDEESDEEIEL